LLTVAVLDEGDDVVFALDHQLVGVRGAIGVGITHVVDAAGQLGPGQRDHRAARTKCKVLDLRGREVIRRVGRGMLALEFEEGARFLLQPLLDQLILDPRAQQQGRHREQGGQAETQHDEGNDDASAQPTPVEHALSACAGGRRGLAS
jgi:hypothetical protein